MADTQVEQKPWQAERLTAVNCAVCGHPVCRFDPRVVGALAGGFCTFCWRERKEKIATYHRLVEHLA